MIRCPEEAQMIQDNFSQAEFELMQYKAIVESSDDAIISKTPDGIITSWNIGACRIYGHSREEALGQPISFLIPEQRQIEDVYLLTQICSGISVKHYETVRKRKDGAMINVSVSLSPIVDTAGNIIGVSSISRNMSEHTATVMAVRESEERFHGLANSAPVLIWLSGLDKLCYWFNDIWLNFTGRTMEQEQGNGWAEGVHPDDMERCLDIYVTSFDNRQRFTMEYRLLRHDGSYRWILDNGAPTYTNGTFTGYVGSCIDITEQKELADRLSGQIQFSNSTLDGLRAYICVIDAEGIIVTTNRAWNNFSKENGGVNERCGIGASYFSVCQTCQEKDECSVDKVMTGIKGVLLGGAAEFMCEYPCHAPDMERWFICKANFFSVAGAKYAVISHEDITWRKEAERELRKLSRAVDQSPVTILITDAEGTIEFVNPHFTKMSGYSSEEVIGQNPRILKSGLTPPETFEELWGTVKAGGTWEGELINRGKNGVVNIEQAKISPIRDENGVITHYIGVKENINSRKEMEASLIFAKEKAEIANRVKDEFLAVMSHEMRTPLNGVIGMSDLLLESDSGLPDELRGFAEITRSCGESLLGIITGILDFTLLKAGKLGLELKPFDLRSTLEDIVRKFAQQAAATLDLTCRVDSSIPPLLKGDVNKIRQVVAIFVDNAIKFASKGAVVIDASFVSAKDRFATIRFEVRDTGIGIPKIRLKEIFSAFTQLDSSTTRGYGGTGLGLSISKELLGLMEGEFGVSSEEGKGTTFWFTLSFEISGDSETACTGSLPTPKEQVTVRPESPALKSAESETTTVGTAPRILLAEDNVINQKVALNVLNKLGFKADVVPDGLKAVKALEKIDYDLVLMDCMMPEMTGYEATAAIREPTSKVLNHLVPIVAVTANAMPGDREKCIESGMDDYMAKPLKMNALSEMIDKWLEHKK